MIYTLNFRRKVLQKKLMSLICWHEPRKLRMLFLYDKELKKGHPFLSSVY